MVGIGASIQVFFYRIMYANRVISPRHGSGVGDALKIDPRRDVLKPPVGLFDLRSYFCSDISTYMNGSRWHWGIL